MKKLNVIIFMAILCCGISGIANADSLTIEGDPVIFDGNEINIYSTKPDPFLLEKIDSIPKNVVGDKYYAKDDANFNIYLKSATEVIWSSGTIKVEYIVFKAGQNTLTLNVGLTTTGTVNIASLQGIDISNVSFYGNAVPIPAAVWLFGTGLAGLFGIRRKLRR